MDTGATNYVTGEKDCFLDLFDISPCPVCLPNGDLVVATQKGYVRLSSTIILTNVLNVPQFHCSLVSVSQLTNDLHCIFQNFSSMGAAQDHLREFIETRRRKDGLYYFNRGHMIHKSLVHWSLSCGIDGWVILRRK